MNKTEFREWIFKDEQYSSDITLLKNRLVYLYQFEEYEKMSKIQFWIEELSK